MSEFDVQAIDLSGLDPANDGFDHHDLAVLVRMQMAAAAGVAFGGATAHSHQIVLRIISDIVVGRAAAGVVFIVHVQYRRACRFFREQARQFAQQ